MTQVAQIFEEEKQQALTQVAQIFEEEKQQAIQNTSRHLESAYSFTSPFCIIFQKMHPLFFHRLEKEDKKGVKKQTTRLKTGQSVC